MLSSGDLAKGAFNGVVEPESFLTVLEMLLIRWSAIARAEAHLSRQEMTWGDLEVYIGSEDALTSLEEQSETMMEGNDVSSLDELV